MSGSPLPGRQSLEPCGGRDESKGKDNAIGSCFFVAVALAITLAP